MHPDDVAALVADEFGDLQRQIADRADPGIGAAVLAAPTLITVEVSTRAYQSEVVGTGLQLPGNLQTARRIPILSAVQRRRLVLVVECSNWDGTPPEFDLRLPNGAPLPEWPKGTTNGGIARGHPHYTRPFICRPGTREFHSHPVHADDPWDMHREGMTLSGITLGILEDLSNRWVMG
jgi:hypothetical protein